LRSDKTRKFEFSIETAQHPSNINWENTHKSKFERFLRILSAFVLMTVVLLIGWTLLYSTQRARDLLFRSYPAVDCELLMGSNYSNSLMKRFALIEWYNIKKEDGMTREIILQRSTSNLQCYCNELVQIVGFEKAKEQIFHVKSATESFKGEM
jgi:hypothetical protein